MLSSTRDHKDPGAYAPKIVWTSTSFSLCVPQFSELYNPNKELNEFERLEVWELVPRPDKVMVISLKWIYKVKLDKLGGILKNMARLVARGYRQEEGVCRFEEECFCSGCKIRGYKDFSRICAYKNMVVYQMDVKTAFLNGFLWEEVYVSQPDGFVDLDNPNHVYKLKKALYGLKQAPRAWYDMLSSFLISQDFSKDSVDLTLFIQKEGKELLLGLWYPKDSSITLTAFADANHASCQDTRPLAHLEKCAPPRLIDFGVACIKFLKGLMLLWISGIYTSRLLDAACKKVLTLLKKGLLVKGEAKTTSPTTQA
ncbi:retrovirus-related pol polyprotein from transposon TNT 1-94 [Tanacetum coccineum]|uniref:Retrovirus-related pol polyprotein from transposon TNT 1-94 n=1 Tax=Tanacetum coccineum TaxID=301880 RepID=A0ABQ5G8K4_9ASTR